MDIDDKMEVISEKLISDFVDEKIGYRQVYDGLMTVDGQKILYKRFVNITDIDRFGNVYTTDTIDIISEIDEDVYLIDDIEDFLTH